MQIVKKQQVQNRVRTASYYSAGVLTFLCAVGLYVFTLAPTVTFEDSGELISAAYRLGVPHEPGYPLFTMLSHLFSYLPIGNIAYRINLASAFFSALGALFLTWATFEALQSLKKSKESKWLVFTCAVSCGVLFAVSFENWEQSIITEVYGLHTAFVGAILWLVVQWICEMTEERRVRLFYLLCFVLGLALSNHPTTVLLVPALMIYVLIIDRPFLWSGPRFLKGTGCMAAGLLPYLYLPIASSRNPVMDWGNPENLTNFLRVVMRHQYQLNESQSLRKFFAQLGAYGQFIQDQWVPFVFLLVFVGVTWLFRRHRRLAWLTLLLFGFTGPLTTFLTNFDVATANPVVNAEHKALVSVFYIPSYMVLTLVLSLCLFLIAEHFWRKPSSLVPAVLLFSILPAGTIYRNLKRVDMSNYVFTEDYVNNLFHVVPDHSVVFVNWDPFIFPLNYYQLVEDRRTDIMVIDQELLRRSWYIQSLQDHHADFLDLARREVDDFLKAIQPFENGDPYDGKFIQSKYVAMINALIDRSYDTGHSVFLTYDPEPDIAAKYFKESVLAAVKLRLSMDSLTALDPADLSFRGFDGSIPMDRMARFFKTYYGRLFYARGYVAGALGDRQQAFYLFKRSLTFLSEEPTLRITVQQAIDELQRTPSPSKR